jgi:hypothetical protein
MLSGPPNVGHIPTEADARCDGEEGQEATEVKVQAKQHLVEKAASRACVVVKQEHSSHTCQAVES